MPQAARDKGAKARDSSGIGQVSGARAGARDGIGGKGGDFLTCNNAHDHERIPTGLGIPLQRPHGDDMAWLR